MVICQYAQREIILVLFYTQSNHFICLPSSLRMHYLKLPTAIVHRPVTAKQDALEGLAKLGAEYRINDL